MQVNSDPDAVASLCSELARRLRLLERTEGACCGVPLSQSMVLQILAGSGGSVSMSEVAAAVGVAQSTATRLVDPLEKRGLVERRAASQDGRVVEVRLTAEGERAASKVVGAARRWSRGILERIPASRHREVVAALQCILTAVEDCCSRGCQPVEVEATTAASSGTRRTT